MNNGHNQMIIRGSMMTVDVNKSPEAALKLLKEKLHEWRDTTTPIWPSTWPIFERLIDRHEEMATVYMEIATLNITGSRLWVLLEQLIHAGSFGTEERYADLRADYQELTRLNEDISIMSIRLAEMLERRSELLNHSGHFYCERMTSLTDLIDEAGQGEWTLPTLP
ncbi:hypothetical protein ABLB90_22530 [Photorhabdus bodei]|uniref:hypothetical protein n=1 Tax=Photorhabdus bodei TaxID=2029681 RepID=UPI0032B8313F